MPPHVTDTFKIYPQLDQVLYLDERRYVVRSSPIDESFEAHKGPHLITIFTDIKEKSIITEQWMKRQIQIYQQTDDVFHPAFLQGIILVGDSRLDANAHTFLETAGMKWCHVMTSPTGERKIKSGPYVLLNGYLRNVYRAYSDTSGAFYCALEYDGKSYRTPNLLEGNGDSSLIIAVPSRLQSQPSTELPMAGLRVAVKDNFDIEGIRTALSSRPFHETYPPKQKTAPCIQRLTDLGALIVGKTKLTSFATWEEPIESIDFPAPWNPRADGFLSAGGSSNGSGAAISSYDWLDIAIGSDTTGSVMRPALWNGCFAMRPSHGVLSAEGFFSCIEYLDTPGFLGRDLEVCRDFAAAWYGSTLVTAASNKPISSFIWPTDYWQMLDSEQCELALKFVHDMESHLNLKYTHVSFKEVWDRHPPAEAEGRSLNAYMLEATEHMWYDDYHAFDDFRKEYHSRNQKPPYVSPPTQKAWDSFKSITEAQRDEAIRRLGIFRIWFRKIIINAEHENAMLILPIERVYPRYRDETHNFQRPPIGVHNLLLASLHKSPELVLPIGQIPYYSKITQREEQLPFSIGLMGLPGNDLQLFDTALACLKKAGRPTVVQTGSTMFSTSKLKGSL